MRSSPLRPRRPRSALVLAFLVVAGLVLSACGDDDSDNAQNDTTGGPAGATAGTTTTTTAPADDGATTTSLPAGGATGDGCAATGSGRPAGATTAPAIDVDGDGRDDTAWLSGATGGERRFGITTASGATFSTPFSSASPIAASALAFEPDGQLPAYALISDGRIGSLWLLADCRITAVVNVQGDPYTFDLGGFTGYGTGVGCIDADGDGRRDLVGLLAESVDASTTRIKRTIIELDGARGSNGVSDEITAHSPHDDAEIESARSVSCGELTLDRNGVHEPE
jgi:hypothetical protein